MLYLFKLRHPYFWKEIFLVFRKKDLYLVVTQKLIILESGRFHEITFMKSGGFHLWNPADFMKSVKSGGFHANFMKSGRFHVKSTWKPYKSKNSRKTLQFHGVQWEGYVMISHEICQISWNPPGFERPLARNGNFYVFQLYIYWQSHFVIHYQYLVWKLCLNCLRMLNAKCPGPIGSECNSCLYAESLSLSAVPIMYLFFDFFKRGTPSKFGLGTRCLYSNKYGTHLNHQFSPDFTCEIHPNDKSKCFSKNSSVWWMQGGGFHPRNPVDFTLKSGGFQPWNLVDFTQISPVKSTQNYR